MSPTLCSHVCLQRRDDNPAQCFVGFVTRVCLQSAGTQLSWPTGLTLGSLAPGPHGHTRPHTRETSSSYTGVSMVTKEARDWVGGPRPIPHVAWVPEKHSRALSEVSGRTVRACSDLRCHRYQNLGAASFPFPRIHGLGPRQATWGLSVLALRT